MNVWPSNIRGCFLHHLNKMQTLTKLVWLLIMYGNGTSNGEGKGGEVVDSDSPLNKN